MTGGGLFLSLKGPKVGLDAWGVHAAFGEPKAVVDGTAAGPETCLGGGKTLASCL